MAGLVPAIHVFIFVNRSKDVDARHKVGHVRTRPVADMANEGLKKSVVYDRLSFLLYD
jgi:hypothetical protein